MAKFCDNCVFGYGWEDDSKPFPEECKKCELVDGKPTNYKPKTMTNEDIMCDKCICQPVCEIYRATGGVKKCKHVKEERKGKWITDEKGTTYCGRCRHIDDYASVHNYCPICGCDMRGAEDG